ncbi:MAG: tetratricopeptide repeat protein [Candidatus Omnitrophica bacterium]|nr:tetratricopeptide repeat protein [Candidatus Omnitrophota bacterium]
MKRTNNISYFFFLLILLFLFFHDHAFCGVVTFKSGKELQGLIIKKTDKELIIKVGPDEETYALEDIESIKGNKPRNILPGADGGMQEPLDFNEALKTAANGSFLHAEEQFKNILEKNPYDFNAKEALRAIDDYKKGLISQEYTVSLFKGAYYFLNNQFEKAVEVYKKALDINPEASEIYYNLASSYYFLGDEKDAIFYFEKLVKTDPEDMDVLFNLGSIYYSLEDHKKAIYYFEKLLELFPDDPQSLAFLGTSYYATGQYSKSRKYLEKARILLEDSGNKQEAKEVSELLANLP